MIASGRWKLIIDGVYGKAPQGFSSIPIEMREHLLKGEAPFGGITHLLVSHYHRDHFGFTETVELLKHEHPLVFLPDNGQYIKRISSYTECIAVPTARNTFFSYPIGDGNTIEAFSIGHSGRRLRDMTVICYILHLCGKHFLFLSDAQFDPDYLVQMAGKYEYDAVFANPLFLDIQEGREALINRLDAKALCIYHLPYPADDIYGLVEMAKSNIRQYVPADKRVILFDSPEIRFTL